MIRFLTAQGLVDLTVRDTGPADNTDARASGVDSGVYRCDYHKHTARIPLTSLPVVGVLLLLLLLMPASSLAEEKPSDPGLDPFADRLVATTSAYLTSAERFSFHAEMTFEEVFPNGQKLQFSRTVDIMVKRPDRLRMELLDDRGRRRIFYDGKTLSMHQLEQNVYATIEVPATIDEMVDHIHEHFDIEAPLVDLLVSDLYENYRQNTTSGTYLGLHHFGSIKHHHLLLSNDEVDYQIWLEDSASPAPKKIVITHVNRPGLPQITGWLTAWDFDPRLPDFVFRFAPPADAEEIEVLAHGNSSK